jgi:hypothetical protein
VPPRSHRPHHASGPGYHASPDDPSAGYRGQEWTSTTHGTGSGTHRFEDPPDTGPDEDIRQPEQARDSYTVEDPGEPPNDSVAELRARGSELSKQECTQLLIDTIQLFDDVWKLASIRSNERNNWMIAYLVPRNKKHLDLRTAISKRQVLVITIDEMGNTDIREPQKRGLWQRLTAWLVGE